MELDRLQLQQDIHALYEREHAELGEQGTLDHLERGRRWDLSGTLRAGGVLVFPHTSVKDCGYQVAACVQACLDSGTDQVLVISVLHAFTDDMEQARRRVAAGGDQAIGRIPDQAAEHRHIEERHQPPQSRDAQNDMTISLEARQCATVGEHETGRPLRLRVADDG